MARFEYLGGRKARRRRGREQPGPDAAGAGERTGERLEAVYVRKETVRAVWRQLRAGGTEESVSELVEDLLIRWLRDRA